MQHFFDITMCLSGPRSSALVGGFTTTHRKLENVLAKLKGTQDCLLFPSGFAANTSVLCALATGPDCAIFSDALNHASIIDGCRLALRTGVQLHVYRYSTAANWLLSTISAISSRVKWHDTAKYRIHVV